eukprot:1372530-Amorphochlora_amoeboformis.AAC.1
MFRMFHPVPSSESPRLFESPGLFESPRLFESRGLRISERERERWKREKNPNRAPTLSFPALPDTNSESPGFRDPRDDNDLDRSPDTLQAPSDFRFAVIFTESRDYFRNNGARVRGGLRERILREY